MNTARPLATASVMLIATGASAIAALIWVTNYAHQPLWTEHASYGMWANIQFHEALVRDGYARALRASLGTRHILQPALLGAVSPQLLAWPHAHLLVTALSFYLFLYLLSRYVRQRTGSAALAVAAALLFCTLAGLYDENQGMGVPWPDYQSMFFMSSGVLSVVLCAVSGTPAWLGLAGACVTLATLARDTGAVYAAVTTLPLVAWLVLREFRRGGPWPGARLLLWFALPALPAGLLLLHNVAFFQQYYMTSNAYQLRQPFGLVVSSILASIVRFCGVVPLVAIVVLVAAALLRQPRNTSLISGMTPADLMVSYWPASYFLLLVVNGYDATGVTKEVMYIVPGLVCLAATVSGGIDIRSRLPRGVLVSALAACVLACGVTAVKAYDRVRDPDPDEIAAREDQMAVAGALASFPGQVWWHSYTRLDWGPVGSALTFYQFRHYQPTEGTWFYNKKSYWDAHFPGRDLPELEADILSAAERRVDVAIVLTHPDIQPHGMEDYSFRIASSVAKHIEADPQWKHYRDVQTVSGLLSLYVNQRRTAR